VNKLSSCGALIALVFLISGGIVFGQDTRSTTAGSRDASIQTATTTGQLPQTDQQRARPTPTPVTPVRPLSQEDRQRQEASSARRRQEAATGDPDVLLDVPNLSVDEITLDVENLRARVSLDARLANLLQLTAGADVGIDKVKLTIKGVRAEVLLKVRLDNVAAIIDRTLTTIDRNPQILERLLQSVDTTVGTVGGVANTALGPGGAVSNLTAPNGLLSQTVNTLGQTVQRTVDRAGNLVERTVDTAGKVVNQKTVGNVSSLSVLSETTNTAGQVLRRVTDTSGAVIELTLDAAGKVVNSRVVSQATGNK
jgi:hypothetical protein